MTDLSRNGSGTDQLRQLVREVLAEALPGLARRADQPGPAAPRPAPPAAPAPQPAPAPLPPTPPSSVPAADTERPASGRPTGPAGPAGSGEPAAGGPAGSAGPGRPAAGPWTVRLSTDDELHAFVLRVLKIADNPKLRRDLIGGRIRFSLAGQATGQVAQAAHRVEAGAVTERTVAAAGRAGARLVLGPRAVLTPLARDKARALGITIEKER